VVGVLLLVDVKPAWRGIRRAIPTPARHVDAFEAGVVIYPVHRFRRWQALHFLARHAVVGKGRGINLPFNLAGLLVFLPSHPLHHADDLAGVCVDDSHQLINGKVAVAS
jgi:hypothetical protein